MHRKAKFETPLRHARGLGSAKEGVHHWLMQRISAVILIPLMLWIVFVLLPIAHKPSAILSLLSSPFHLLPILFFMIISCYHGHLGMQVIFEDYIHCTAIKITAKILLLLVSSFTAIVGIVAILTFAMKH